MIGIVEIAMAGVFFGVVNSKKFKVEPFKWSVLICLVLVVINYFALPTLSMKHLGIWCEFFVVSFLAFAFFFMLAGKGSTKAKFLISIIPLAVSLLAFVVMFFTTFTGFHAKDYSRLLDVEVRSIETIGTMPKLLHKAFAVDENTAQMLAEEKLKKENFSEDYKIGNVSFQKLTADFKNQNGHKLIFKDEYVWVAPLERAGIRAPWTKDNGYGYVIVSARNQNAVFIVTEVNDVPMCFRYTETACGFYDIERKIYTSGGASFSLIKNKNFYISKNGKPLWIIPIFENKVGFSGKDVVGMIYLDPLTGEFHQTASLEEGPLVIQPKKLIEEQIRDWGMYSHGFWYSLFGENRKSFMISQIAPCFHDGNLYWGADIRLCVNDKTESGIILVDTKTKKTLLYLSDEAALQWKTVEAQKEIPEEPQKKSVKRGVQPVKVVSSGENTISAKRAKQIRDAVMASRAGKTTQKRYAFTISSYQIEGEIYYLQFAEFPGIEFMGTSEFFAELKWSYSDDLVRFGTAVDPRQAKPDSISGSILIPLTYFDNPQLNLTKDYQKK